MALTTIELQVDKEKTKSLFRVQAYLLFRIPF